jgi:hypothetical protein
LNTKTANLEINIDMSIVDNVKKALADPAYGKVGVLSSSGERGGAAYIAAVHEFGARPRVTPKMRGWFFHHFGVRLSKNKQFIEIPERSFLRSAMHNRGADFQTFAEASGPGIFRRICAGQWRDVLSLLSSKWVGYVQEMFSEQMGMTGHWKPLHPLTVATRKGGSSVPLQDTGALLQSITHEVTDGSK